jgi:hypothetical protein
VETCGNAVAYVQALTELEQMRPVTPRLAMAANGGSLVSRVQRLLRGNRTTSASPAGWLAGIGIAVCLLAAGIAASGFAQRPAPAVLAAQEAEVPTPAPEQAPAPPSAPAPKAAQTKEDKKTSGGWLDEIQQAGFRDLDVDKLIALKIHDVNGEYIRQMRARGLQPTADQLVALRIHDVTAEFIDGLKQAGLTDLKADDLIALRIHGADPASIREIQAMGYTKLTVDDIVTMRIHDVTPAFIRDAEKHGLKGLSLQKLVELKITGVL